MKKRNHLFLHYLIYLKGNFSYYERDSEIRALRISNILHHYLTIMNAWNICFKSNLQIDVPILFVLYIYIDNYCIKGFEQDQEYISYTSLVTLMRSAMCIKLLWHYKNGFNDSSNLDSKYTILPFINQCLLILFAVGIKTSIVYAQGNCCRTYALHSNSIKQKHNAHWN